ncbi:MAG: Flp pilus assembly protein CpaB [Desulfobulbaceae bacterium]|nr:Flp pilus assembly protein CpaB [Desulfobulbaceae bacterium]
MNLNKRLIFLILALAIAAAVSFLTFKMLTEKPGEKPAAKVETELIAVATKDLDRGVKLAREDMRQVPFLKDSLPLGAHTDATQLVGRTLIMSLKNTEPILESKLAPTGTTAGGLAVIVSPGKRAMSVKVDKVIGVAGFVQPGHFVDVLVSIKKPGDQAEHITKIILENILVLSSGTEMQEVKEGAEKGAKNVAVDVVTLEVTPKEAEKLGMAVNQGKIQLALRNYTDTADELTRGATVSTLLSSYLLPGDTVVVKKDGKNVFTRKGPGKIVVEVMNGNNIQRVDMKRR